MKKLIVCLLVVLITVGVVLTVKETKLAHATPGGLTSDVLDTAVTNLPDSFTDADAERLTDLKYKTRVAITNDTSTAIFVCWKSNSASDCPANGDWYVPAGGSFIFDQVATSKSVFLKSAGAAISSGIIATGTY